MSDAIGSTSSLEDRKTTIFHLSSRFFQICSFFSATISFSFALSGEAFSIPYLPFYYYYFLLIKLTHTNFIKVIFYQNLKLPVGIDSTHLCRLMHLAHNQQKKNCTLIKTEATNIKLVHHNLIKLSFENAFSLALYIMHNACDISL